MLKRYTVHIFHDQSDGPTVVDGIVQSRDVGMIEPGVYLNSRLNRSTSSVSSIPIGSTFMASIRLGDDVLDFVHGTHSAGAGEIDHLVVLYDVTWFDHQLLQSLPTVYRQVAALNALPSRR